MLLTVHNLPLSITYSDLKTLIYNKCGLSDTILDQLVNEGGTKKVTIGVADEGDAAILARKINGLFLNGQHLYVEDVRKQRGSEQPYRSTSAVNNQKPYYQTTPGYDSMMEQKPPMENYNMNQMNYYAPPDQNFSSMGYGNQNQSFAKQTPYSDPEQTYGYETQRVEDTYKSGMSLDRNSRRDSQRGRSPQRSQGREQNFPKTSRWVIGNPVPESEIRKRTPPRESWNARNRDQQNVYRPPKDNYRDQEGAFRQLSDNYHDQENAFGPPNDNYRDQQNSFGPSNDNYRDQQKSFRPPNNDYHGRELSQGNMARNFEQQVSYDIGYTAVNNQGGVFDRMDMNPYGSKIYGNHVTESQVRGPASSQWKQKEELQTKHSKLDFSSPRSNDKQHFPSKNDADRYRAGSGFSKNSRGVGTSRDQSGFASNQLDKASAPQFGGSASNRKAFEKSSQPAVTSSRSADNSLHVVKSFNDRNSLKQSKGMERESRKRPHNVDDRDSGLQKKKYGRDAHRGESLKFKQNEPKIGKDQESDILKQINKDQTWRGQAASKIAKQIMQKHARAKATPRLLQQLKTSIRTRIDVLLGDQFAVPCDEIVDLYRKRFRYKNDKTFYYAVLENENLADKAEDKTPNKEHTVTNVSKDLNFTTKQTSSGKPPAKQETNKNVAKSPNLALDQNLSGKAMSKVQKKIAKLEYQGEQTYTLPLNLQKALDEEMHTFIDIFNKECEDPKDDAEKSICRKITDIVSEDFKKIVGLNVTKRILNVRTGLALRVIGVPKPPKKASLLEFLKSYGGIVVNKSEAKKMFIATVDSYEHYDKLCGMGSVLIDDVAVKFCPIHITGPPQKITRAEIMEKRNQWIQNQIDKSSGKGDTDIAGQSNPEVSQNQNSTSSEMGIKTDDTKSKIEDKDGKHEVYIDAIDEECIIIEDEDTENVVEEDYEIYENEANTDEAKVEDVEIDELLEAEIDENDLEDY